MTEQYVASRDAMVSGEVAVGRAKARGSTVPHYARKAVPKPKGLSGKALWDAVDAMSGRIIH